MLMNTLVSKPLNPFLQKNKAAHFGRAFSSDGKITPKNARQLLVPLDQMIGTPWQLDASYQPKLDALKPIFAQTDNKQLISLTNDSGEEVQKVDALSVDALNKLGSQDRKQVLIKLREAIQDQVPGLSLLESPTVSSLTRLPYLNDPGVDNKFLLGLCRSGTTIAAKCLTAPLNNDVYGIHEPNGPAAHTHVDTYGHLGQLPQWPFAGKLTPLSTVFNAPGAQHGHPLRTEAPGSTTIVKTVVDRHVMDDMEAIYGDKTDLTKYFRSNPLGLGTGLINIKRGKPVWILRNPIDIWASIKHQNWHTFDQTLHDTFEPASEMVLRLKEKLGDDLLIINFEDFIDPNKNKAVVKKVWDHWGVDYTDKMLEQEGRTAEDYYNFMFVDKLQRADMIKQKSHETLFKPLSIPKDHRGIVDSAEMSQLDDFMPTYQEMKNLSFQA